MTALVPTFCMLFQARYADALLDSRDLLAKADFGFVYMSERLLPNQIRAARASN